MPVVINKKKKMLERSKLDIIGPFEMQIVEPGEIARKKDKTLIDSLEARTEEALKKALDFIEQWACKMVEKDADKSSTAFPEEARPVFTQERMGEYRQKALEEMIRSYKESFPNWLVRESKTAHFLGRAIIPTTDVDVPGVYPSYYFCGNRGWYERNGAGFLGEPPDAKRIERPLMGKEYLEVLRSTCRMILSEQFVGKTMIAYGYYVFEYKTWQLNFGADEYEERKKITVVTPSEAGSLGEAVKKISPWGRNAGVINMIRLQRVGTRDGWRLLRPTGRRYGEKLSLREFYEATFLFSDPGSE